MGVRQEETETRPRIQSGSEEVSKDLAGTQIGSGGGGENRRAGLDVYDIEHAGTGIDDDKNGNNNSISNKKILQLASASMYGREIWGAEVAEATHTDRHTGAQKKSNFVKVLSAAIRRNDGLVTHLHRSRRPASGDYWGLSSVAKRQC